MARKYAYSFTRIRDFMVCPYLFMLKHIKKVPYQEVPILKQGNLIHKLLQRYTLACHKAKKSNLFEKWEDITMNTIKDYAIPPEYEAEAIEIFKHYVQSREIELKGLAGVEMRIAVNEEFEEVDWMDKSVFFRLIIDKLYLRGDMAHIIDYKSGFSTKADEFQLQIYGWMINKLYPHITNIVVEYDFVRLFFTKAYQISPSDLPSVNKRIYARIQAIEEADGWPPSVGEQCYTCPYWTMCPKMQIFEKEYKMPDGQEDIADLFEEYIRLDKKMSHVKTILKKTCDGAGKLTGKGMMASYNRIESNNIDIPAFITLANKAGKSVLDLLSIDGRKLSSKKEELKDVLKLCNDVKVSTRFEIKKEPKK